MMHANRSAALVVGCLFGVIASSAMGQDWPQWRGPNRDAKATAFAPPAAWPKTLEQKWKTQVGLGVATPALVGDRLYVFARQEDNEVTSCLDAATGKELWRDAYPALAPTGPAAQYSGPRASPAVADGKVVTLGVRGTLSCLDAASGKKLWRKDDFTDTPKFYAASSPLLIDGLCIAQLGGADNGGIVAYDLAGGEQKWKWTGDGPSYASPVIMTLGEQKLLIAETDQNIVALRLADGKEAWKAAFAAHGMGVYNAATPAVDGQTLIYSGAQRGTFAIKIEKQGDSIAAKELWSNNETSVQFTSPVIKEGAIYGLTQGNELFCLDEQSGKKAWSTALGPTGQAGPGPRPDGAGPRPERQGRPGGPGGRRGGGRGGYGSIVDAGAILLALTPKSELVVFQPSEKAFSEVARIKVADSPTYAYPVLSGKRVFIKDQDSVTLLATE